MRTADAMKLARAENLDLVEVGLNDDVSVCRIMDFGKYKYNQLHKEKHGKKHRISGSLKEVKFHANVEKHDYAVKLMHIHKFLEKGHRVRASLMFRGRENEHRELGYKLMERLVKDCEGCGAPESKPRLLGRNLVLMLNAQHGTKDNAKSSSNKP